MDELRDEILQFTRDRDWDQFHSPENLAKSISIEAGELLECFQWGSAYNQEEVEMELADVVNYCIQLADKLGVGLEDIVRKKLQISAQKYPIDKSKGNSRKYTEL